MKAHLEGWQFGRRVKDDRGSLTLVRHTFWAMQPTARDRHAMKAQPWMRKMSVVTGIYGGFVGVSVFAVMNIVPSTLPFWQQVLASMLWASTLAFFFSRFSFHPMMRWWVQRRIDRSECGGCTFSLAGLNPEPDGCTVCPECGAAWRLPSADAADPHTRTLS